MRKLTAALQVTVDSVMELQEQWSFANDNDELGDGGRSHGQRRRSSEGGCCTSSGSWDCTRARQPPCGST
jgi:hypothetical protein